MDYRKFESKRLFWHTLTVPIIWLPLVPLVVLDIFTELYQFICFPIYGIAKVKRGEYIQIKDRAKLVYLNPVEKLACMYCGYANGVLLYLKEIGGRTEKYWCGIMHENKPGFKAQADQIKQDFAQYGDKKEFEAKYPVK